MDRSKKLFNLSFDDVLYAVDKRDPIEQLRIADHILSDEFDNEYVTEQDCERIAEIYYHLQDVLADIYAKYETKMGFIGFGGC